MKKYMLALGLSLLTVLGLFTGCSPKAETASDPDSLKIVATIFPDTTGCVRCSATGPGR